MHPAVSCLCLTYGRTKTLEESVESFLRQDYPGRRELLILNDLAEQILRCDAPGVRVINLAHRCPNLGAKRNEAANRARYGLLITWSDDDVFLPGRISANVAEYDHGRYVKEGVFFFDDGGNISRKHNSLPGPFLMAAPDFWRLGGIPHMDSGEDQAFYAKASAKLEVRHTQRPTYVYRWGTGYHHISALPRHGPGGEWEAARVSVHRQMAAGKEPRGFVNLRPQWRRDYVALCKAAS